MMIIYDNMVIIMIHLMTRISYQSIIVDIRLNLESPPFTKYNISGAFSISIGTYKYQLRL